MTLHCFSFLAQCPRRIDSALLRKGTRSFGVANASATPAWPLGVYQGGACMHNCPKCQGFLVPEPSTFSLITEYFIDNTDLQEGGSRAVRCVNCGWFSDPVMQINRAKQSTAIVAVAA